jgi:hypothetical protein
MYRGVEQIAAEARLGPVFGARPRVRHEARGSDGAAGPTSDPVSESSQDAWTAADADAIVLMRSALGDPAYVYDLTNYRGGELVELDRSAALLNRREWLDGTTWRVAAAERRVKRRAYGMPGMPGVAGDAMVPAHWLVVELTQTLFGVEAGEPSEPELLNSARLAHELGGYRATHCFRRGRQPAPRQSHLLRAELGRPN